MAVHAVMYGYYTLKALSCESVWLKRAAPFITLIQILQMILGTALVLLGVFFQVYGHVCALSPCIAFGGTIMYTSYGKLFIDFYRKAYRAPSKVSMKNL